MKKKKKKKKRPNNASIFFFFTISFDIEGKNDEEEKNARQ
jgi:hypothetical protein